MAPGRAGKDVYSPELPTYNRPRFPATIRCNHKTSRAYWQEGFFREPSHPDRTIAGVVLLQALRHCSQ